MAPVLPTVAPNGLTAEQQQRLFDMRMQHEQAEHEARIELIKQQYQPAQRGPTAGLEDKATIGETPEQVRDILSSVLGIPTAQIVLVTKNKFIAENLYRLRIQHDRSYTDAAGTVTLGAGGKFQVKKAKGQLKDFRTDTRIWSKGFLNYAKIISLLFGATHASMPAALILFYNRIVKLARIY